MKRTRYDHSAVVVGSTLAVFAGVGPDEKIFNSIEMRDLSQNPSHWQEVAEQPILSKRKSMLACSISEYEVLLFGGMDRECYGDMFIFNVKKR